MAKKNIGRRSAGPKGRRRDKNFKLKNYLLLGVGVALIALAVWLIVGSDSGKDHGDLKIVENLPVEPDACNVHTELHLDNSTSMAGFTSNGTNGYFAVLNKMRFAYEGNPVFYVGDSIYKGDDLITDLQKHEVSMKGASRIDQDLDALFKKAGENKTGLYIYLTDGIMSGSDEEINRTPAKDFNLTHKDELSDRIKRAVAGNAGTAVSVYQFTSDFNGEYYAYNNENNNHKPIKGTHAFYAIAIGNPGILADFKNKMNVGGKGVVVPENQWHYIDKLPLAWKPKVEVSGVKESVTENHRNSTKSAPKAGKTAPTADKSTTRSKTAGMPLYVINSKIVLQNIPDKDENISSKDTKRGDKSNNGAYSRNDKGICFRLKTANFKNQTVNFKQLADSLEVRIGGTKIKPAFGPVYIPSKEAIEFWYPYSLLKNGAVINLSIPQIYPVWVEEYNTDNDLYILSKSFIMGDEIEKTFLLKYLVNGLRNGKVNADTPLFDTTFKIEFE